MFIKLSKNNLLFQFGLLILVSLILWGKAFVSEGFFNGTSWGGWAVSLLMVAGACYVVQRQQVSRNPGIQGIIFLCLMVPHLGTAYTPQIWVYPLFLLSFYYTFNMYGKENPYPDVFNAAFFWSAATVFFPDLFFTLPCLLIVLLVYAVGNWHMWLTSITGMGTPYLILAAIDFLSGQNILAQNMAQIQVFGHAISHLSEISILPGVLLLFCVILSTLSLISSRQFMQDLEMIERRKSSAMAIMFFYLVLFVLLSAGKLPPAHRFPLFFPTAFFCTKCIIYTRQSVLKETLFILIIALSVWAVWL